MDPMSTLKTLITIAIAVQKALRTAKKNRNACEQLAKRTEALQAVLTAAAVRAHILSYLSYFSSR